MTVDQVEEEIEEIRRVKSEMDDEMAHAAEDALYTRVLIAIAWGRSDDPEGLAFAALKSKQVEFHRWCA